MRLENCLAVCWLLSSAAAFYPIRPWAKHGDGDLARRYETTTSPDRRSISLPLRRVRRDNTYNIVDSQTPTEPNAVAIDQDGSDLSYMIALTFGSSKEEYHLLLDSAASNTWVMADSCSTEACGTHNTLGSGESSSLKTVDTNFSITYGTGSVSGALGTDTVHISSLSASLTFGLANNVSSEFSSYPMDGIVGMGVGDDSAGNVNAPTFMDALASAGLLNSKLFAIHLSRARDGINDGELDIGEINSARYSGSLNNISTLSNNAGFWEIPIDDAGVDGSLLGVTGRSAILDSGTSFILMPEDDAVQLHDKITGSTHSGETFTVPCSTTEPVQFVLGGQTYNVSAADYIGSSSSHPSDENCNSNIIGRQTFGANQWLMGDVFLKNVYAVFDFDNSHVGLGVQVAEQAAASSGVSSSAGATATATGISASRPPSEASGTAAASAQAQQSATASPSHTGSATKASPSSPLLLLALSLLSLFK